MHFSLSAGLSSLRFLQIQVRVSRHETSLFALLKAGGP